MRFVRTIAGMLLLAVGIPALLAGAGLWTVARHADPDGGFGARFETVRTSGQAVVVTDVDDLLRAEAPFVRTAQARLRLTARTADGPAFLGLAPSDEVGRWLEAVPHATVSRVALARGPLPVRLEPAGPVTTTATTVPAGQGFWVREGTGALEWSPAELAGRSLSLVVMRPDGRGDLALDLRAELRAGWFPGLAWALLAGGVLLVVLAVLLLLRPVRPREVVFVVEPDQVPVLAGRLGVTSLSGLGAPEVAGERPVWPERQLVAVGSAAPARSRAAIEPVPSRRPETLADLPADPSWAWPTATTPQTPRPVDVPPRAAASPGDAGLDS
ncbi:hypothetical protein [Micromonospora sp. MP36]|uniref:hypothetical protein n=1 Tax=unclassified Micromonospora TaxID=2617518 RepID=UPI00351B5573